MAESTKTTILAGGCFWCVETDMEKLPGVINVVSGYSGGSRPNPTYENHHDIDAANPVPHLEVVEVTYDPARVDYAAIVDYYLRHIDPTDGGGQFCDRGPSYRPVIFAGDATEKETAIARLKAASDALKTPLAVEVLDAKKFWPAEDYHQDYHQKNPTRYAFYRWNCGRDKKVAQIWNKASAR